MFGWIKRTTAPKETTKNVELERRKKRFEAFSTSLEKLHTECLEMIEGLQALTEGTAYVIFYRISHSHLFNKLEIHTTFMYTYIYPLSLFTHSLIHKLTQRITHTYVTLEPQRVRSDEKIVQE